MVVLSYFILHFEIWYLGAQQKPCSWASKYDCQIREAESCPDHKAVTCPSEWLYNFGALTSDSAVFKLNSVARLQ